MKRNFDALILQLNGAEFDDKSTLKSVAMLALTAGLPSDQNMSGVDKFKLYQFANRIKDGGAVDLTAEDITLLKDRIGKGFSVVVVGRCYELLDADYVEPARVEPAHD